MTKQAGGYQKAICATGLKTMFIVVLSMTTPELDHIAIGGVRLQLVLVFSIVSPPSDKYHRLISIRDASE